MKINESPVSQFYTYDHLMNQCKVILNLDHMSRKVLNDICGYVKINMSKTLYCVNTVITTCM